MTSDYEATSRLVFFVVAVVVVVKPQEEIKCTCTSEYKIFCPFFFVRRTYSVFQGFSKAKSTNGGSI